MQMIDFCETCFQAYGIPVNASSLRSFMHEHVLPATLRETASDFLANIPA